MTKGSRSRSRPGQPVANDPLAEAKNQLSALVARVERGEAISITRRGVPVARLVREESSSGAAADRAVVESAVMRLRELRSGCLLEGDLKTLAREGLDRSL